MVNSIGSEPREIELSVVMPCLNEAETLSVCIKKAEEFLSRTGITGEIIVADNGSDDGSQRIAERCGAQVINVPTRGYGAALRAGISAANGKFIVMGDADDSYDFSRLDDFISRLREGHDLVMGNRFKGGIEKNAMPALHRYVGNPVLSGLGRLFFRSPLGDFHCGLRAFRKQAIERLDLRTDGMEYASEMVVKATLSGCRIAEVPTRLAKDGRRRAPHLRSWHDGWRHLRFLLMYSPRWLFWLPGLTILLFGTLVMLLLLPGPLTVGTVTFDVHTLMLAAAAIIIGVQTISFAWLAKQFGINAKLLPSTSRFARLRQIISLERAILAGIILMAVGAGIIVFAVYKWGIVGFGDLNYSYFMRLIIPAVTLLAVGFQILLTGFLSGILDLQSR